jgi:hypothetical protein
MLVKSLSTENKDRILKASWEKHQVTHKIKLIRITAGLLTETLKYRREWNEVFQVLKEYNCKPRSLYQAK